MASLNLTLRNSNIRKLVNLNRLLSDCIKTTPDSIIECQRITLIYFDSFDTNNLNLVSFVR